MWFSLLIWSIWKRSNLQMLQMKYRELVRGLFVSGLIYFSASAPLSLFLLSFLISNISVHLSLPHGDRVIWRSVEGSKKGSSFRCFFLPLFLSFIHAHSADPILCKWTAAAASAVANWQPLRWDWNREIFERNSHAKTTQEDEWENCIVETRNQVDSGIIWREWKELQDELRRS